MSNVFTRNRKSTGIEYFDVATDLYIELRRVTGNPNIFPKRTLYSDVVPLILLFKRMRRYISAAHSRFPTSLAQLEKRKEYIQLAIDVGESLMIEIQDAVWGIESVTPDSMEQTGTLLKRELELLRGWKRNSKIQKDRR